MITGKNYIGNKLSATGNSTFKTVNPVLNLENTTLFHEASPSEINEAVAIASQAYREYRQVSGSSKALFLRAIATEIEALGDLLIETYTSESGLPQGRAIGERGRTMGQLQQFATLLEEGSWVEASMDTAQKDRRPIPKVDMRKMLIATGPVVVFGASNFPLAFSTAGGDTAAALAAGCPVIVKAHPMHSGTSELVASAIIKAANDTGMPEGVFSHLNGKGIAVGTALVQHPDVKSVAFTGSLKGGKALFDLANKRPEPIPVFAEMGSLNPVVLLPEILEEKAEELGTNYANSIMMGSGQFCTNPGLLIGIKSPGLERFIISLGTAISQQEPQCMLHPVIASNYNNLSDQMQQESHINTVGQYDKSVAENHSRARITSISAQEFISNPTLHQEVFGPYSLIITCENKQQLQEVVSSLEGQLTATIMGTNTEVTTYKNTIDTLTEKVGRILFNGVPTGVEVCPSMHHGGPFPASTDGRFTSVGTGAIKRFVRPVCFQNWPSSLLPQELQNNNSIGLFRYINGNYSRENIKPS
ncbi:MAG: aldehyde dehydrogenase (NADP(+)) [Flavobacteriaceae bacterium]|nr:MAG: aldehyde dehydrogenase (NADP(+)) [Flavobacteriaceae bacterium]